MKTIHLEAIFIDHSLVSDISIIYVVHLNTHISIGLHLTPDLCASLISE